MADDIKQEESLSTPSSTGEDILPDTGVEEPVGTPGQEQGATPGTPETPPSGEQDLLADGTPKDKPIPYDDARRMSETAARKAVEEYKQQLEQERQAAEEEEQAHLAEKEASSRREQVIQGLLNKYHPDYHETMRPIIEHNVDSMLRMEDRIAQLDEREAELLGRDFIRDHPDVKLESPEFKQIYNEIASGVPAEKAYKLVMKSESKIREDERKKVLEEIKTRNETLRKSTQLGGIGVSKGKPESTDLPSDENDEAWFRKRVR